MNTQTIERIEMIEPEEAEAQPLTLVEQPSSATRAIAVSPEAAPAMSPMAMMIQATANGVPAETIERMMALQERWEANEAKKAYLEAFAAFKAESVEIIKRKRVHFETQKGTTDYKHAELSDVLDAVVPALAKHGLSASWIPKQTKDWIEITCVLKHTKGYSETATLGGPPDQSGGKNSIQAIVSTKTYLERHTFKAVCGVSEKGDDNDGSGGASPDVDADAAAAYLQGFRDASLKGTAALRAHYDKTQPDDSWWARHSRALKDAAKAAEQHGGAK